MTTDRIVTMKCKCDVCSNPASRLILCKACKHVLARCSEHGGTNMQLVRDQHCASGKEARP